MGKTKFILFVITEEGNQKAFDFSKELKDTYLKYVPYEVEYFSTTELAANIQAYRKYKCILHYLGDATHLLHLIQQNIFKKIEVQLCVLDGLFTNTQVKAIIKEKVKAVVTTANPLSEESYEFIGRIYQELERGRVLEDSFKKSRVEMYPDANPADYYYHVYYLDDSKNLGWCLTVKEEGNFTLPDDFVSRPAMKDEKRKPKKNVSRGGGDDIPNVTSVHTDNSVDVGDIDDLLEELEDETMPTTNSGKPADPNVGKIVYSIPNKMQVDKEMKCIVRIGKQHIKDAVMRAGLDDDTVTAESVRIGKVMKVSIRETSNGDNFKIEMVGNNEMQLIGDMNFTQWRFDVTPLRIGKFALTLIVSVQENVPGFGILGTDVVVLDRVVSVKTVANPDAGFITFGEAMSTWNDSLRADIMEAVQNSELDLALESLANFIQDKDRTLRDEISILLNNWTKGENNFNLQLITHEDWNVVQAKVSQAILNIINSIDEMYNKFNAPDKDRLVTLTDDVRATNAAVAIN